MRKTNSMSSAALMIAAVLGIGAASAADLPARTYTKAPAMVVDSTYNWSGFYIGGDFGGERTDISVAALRPGATNTFSARRDVFSGGAHIGYQHQWNSLVLGVEGAYLASGNGTTMLPSPTVSPFDGAGVGTVSLRGRDIWSIGGRAGWALDNWLPYVTGGYARGRSDFNALDSLGSTENAFVRPDGGYIGVGLEWAPWRNGLVLGAEYRHYDFSNKTVTATTSFGFSEPIQFTTKADTVMGRISYKFGPLFGSW